MGCGASMALMKEAMLANGFGGPWGLNGSLGDKKYNWTWPEPTHDKLKPCMQPLAKAATYMFDTAAKYKSKGQIWQAKFYTLLGLHMVDHMPVMSHDPTYSVVSVVVVSCRS